MAGKRVGPCVEALESRRLLTVAFPGVTGPAQYATGGRAGDVYHVTNLTDDAANPLPGSLRYGITTAPVIGRTIVFDIGGTINLLPGGRQGWLEIGTSNLTIAGQTAPGGGITIIGQATKITGSNIILRHLKFRPGQDQQHPGVATDDGIWITGNNVVVDHVSTSWYDDEGISTSDAAGLVTVQYALVGDGLNYNGHAYGSLIGSDVNGSQISYNHILYAQNKSRLPRLGNETGAVNTLDFSNNVIYNWTGNGGYSGAGQLSSTNFINNYYIYGPDGGTTIFSGADLNTQIYQSGNMVDTNKNGVLSDGRAVTWADFKGTQTQLASPVTVDGTGSPESASAALAGVMARSGAFWWSRDAVDARIINEVKTGTGNIINYADAAEWDAVKNAPSYTRQPGWDSDGDGMPDQYEIANGLNPNAADNNGDANGDGYTNLENYINLVADSGDFTPPSSAVAALAGSRNPGAFTVSWSGTDNSGGAGIGNYDVYVSDNGAAYTRWQSATTATSASYTGVAGHTYRFYSIARDKAGNLEAAPASPDATTTVSATPIPASWWKLNETTGATAVDSIGGKNGTLVNMENTDWAPAVSGNGLWFDGTNEYVNVGNNLNATTNFTIAAWVKPNKLSGYQGILGKLTDGSNKQYQLSLNGSKLDFQYEKSGNNYALSGGTLKLGVWQHVAVTITSARLITLYISGVAVASGTAPATTSVSAGNVQIGRWGGTYNSNYLNGGLDDVQFYTSALTAAQVAALVPRDTTAPSSSVAALNGVTPTTSFNVNWTGADNTGGVGILNYDVYVADNGGAYTLWKSALAATAASFTGTAGHTYRFYTRARDLYGNLEAAPASPDATTYTIAATANDYFVDPAGKGAFGDGTRTFSTVQGAINAIPAGTASARSRVFIYRGTYAEKVTINKAYLSLIGASYNAADTVLTWNLNATSPNGSGGTVGTAGSASTSVTATDFTAANLTFANSTHDNIAQAAALYLNSDKAALKNVRMFGFQDTFYANKGRVYVADSYITGDTDFIFGGAAMILDRCTINSSDGGYITAANTNVTKAYGFVFRDCTLTASPVTTIDPATGTKYSNVNSVAAGSVYLGRPWNYAVDHASVTYLNTRMGPQIAAAGWNPWDSGNTDPASTTRYAEYRSLDLNGVLLDVSKRVTWAKQLTDAEAGVYYTNSTILAPGAAGWGSDVWDPLAALATI